MAVAAGGATTEFVDAPSGGGGSSTFTGLTDTPANFTSQGGKFVAVNSGASALEFVDAPSGGGSTSGGIIADAVINYKPSADLVIFAPNVNNAAATVAPNWSTWQTLMETGTEAAAARMAVNAVISGLQSGTQDPAGGVRTFFQARFVRASASANITTTLTAQAAVGATQVTVASATGIKVGHKITVLGNPEGEVTAISGSTLTISPALTTLAASGAAVTVVPEIDVGAAVDGYMRNFDIGSETLGLGISKQIDVDAGERVRVKVRVRRQNRLVDTINLQVTFGADTNSLSKRLFSMGAAGGGGVADAEAVQDIVGGMLTGISKNFTVLRRITSDPFSGSGIYVEDPDGFIKLGAKFTYNNTEYTLSSVITSASRFSFTLRVVSVSGATIGIGFHNSSETTGATGGVLVGFTAQIGGRNYNITGINTANETITVSGSPTVSVGDTIFIRKNSSSNLIELLAQNTEGQAGPKPLPVNTSLDITNPPVQTGIDVNYDDTNGKLSFTIDNIPQTLSSLDSQSSINSSQFGIITVGVDLTDYDVLEIFITWDGGGSDKGTFSGKILTSLVGNSLSTFGRMYMTGGGYLDLYQQGSGTNALVRFRMSATGFPTGKTYRLQGILGLNH